MEYIPSCFELDSIETGGGSFTVGCCTICGGGIAVGAATGGGCWASCGS